MKYSENKNAPSFGGWVIAAGAGLVAAAVAHVVGHFNYAPSGFIGLLVFLAVGLALGIHWGASTMPSRPAAPASKPVPAAEVIPVAAAMPAMAAPVMAAPAMAEASVVATSVSGPAAMFTSSPVAEPVAVRAAKPKAAKPAAKTASKPAAKAAAKPVVAEAKPVAAKVPAKPKVAKAPKVTKPAGLVRLTGPRNGKADDLKEIEGIGPVLEKLCHSLGFYHFDQIAGWSDADVALVDTEMKTFKGRIVRDKWVPQAKIIITEGLDAFRIRAQTNNY